MDELDDMCPIYDRPDFVEINVNTFQVYGKWSSR